MNLILSFHRFSLLFYLNSHYEFDSITPQIFGTIHLVQGHMEDDLPQISTYWQSCTFEISTLSAINAILLLALIPVLDLLMVPLLRHAMIHPSILKRLGVGGIFTLLGMLSLLTLEGLGDRSFSGGSNTCMFGKDTSQESNGMSGYWLILPMVLVTLAQIMIYIPSKFQFSIRIFNVFMYFHV